MVYFNCILTPHWGRDEGIPSECPRFAIHDEAYRAVDVANLGHKDGIPESLPQCGDWLFSHSCLKMCKISLKHILDANFLDCLELTFCDNIGELLLEWASLTLQGGTTFLLTSKLADIPVSRVRKHFPSHANFGYRSVSCGRKVSPPSQL